MKHAGILMLWILLLCCACQEDRSTTDVSLNNDSWEGPLWMIKNVDAEVGTKAVGENDKFWTPGDTIRVKFLNGSTEWQGKVKQYAAGWLEYANLYFEYVGVQDTADVKIGFDKNDKYLSWATIGTDCRLIPQDEVSLNFYGFSNETEAGIKAEVLRGFGHVLGLGFEHKNPGCPMVFADELDVADEYGLTEVEVSQLIDTYNADQINGTEYDRASIMIISVPRILLTRDTRPYATTRNTELSEMDKAFIASIYPVIEQPIVTVKTQQQTVGFAIILTDDIKVDWGDGITETYSIQTGDPHDIGLNQFSHEYTENGLHTIRFYGSDVALIHLKPIDIELTFLDITPNRELKDLTLFNCNLSSIDISNNRKLEFLMLTGNKISAVDVSIFSELRYLAVDNCNLEFLDVSHNPKLKTIECENNKIKVLNLDNNPLLEVLHCGSNLLSGLSVKQNHAIEIIKCENNPFVRNSVELNRLVESLPLRPQDSGGSLSVDSVMVSQIKTACNRKNWFCRSEGY